jgi:hypothetical protein
MLGAATALSVYKPLGKTRLGRRADARRSPAPAGRAGDTAPAIRFDRRGSVERAA